jgi:phage terminase large subunit
MEIDEQPTLNPVLREFWETPARNKILYGGRASSKSWDAAGIATFLADNYKLRVLCVRQFQNRITDSVYSLLKIQIARFGLNDRFDILRDRIINRETETEFMFYGLWRSIDEIKSLEGIDILWIEEAHNLTEEQWKILEPTIRKEGSEIWIVFNPKLVTDFVYKRFVLNPPPDTLVRKINYTENPFLSKTMLKVIEAAKAEDEDEYNHVYLGVPKDDDDEAIIKRSHLLAAIDAHKTLGIDIRGSKRLGFDVADDGEDKCAQVYAHGPLAVWADMWKAKEDELLKSCTRVYVAARERKASIIYDSIGVGATSGAKFNELNVGQLSHDRVSHLKFFAGGAVYKPDSKYANSEVKNKDFFSNIKAQAWWLVADRLRNTYNAVKNGQKFRDDEMIFIDSSMPYLDQLIDELCTPKRDYDLAGRVKVESKKDLDKRDIPSPNLADAFIMAFVDSMLAKPLQISAETLKRTAR